jgi:hypothetical protein
VICGGAGEEGSGVEGGRQGVEEEEAVEGCLVGGGEEELVEGGA